MNKVLRDFLALSLMSVRDMQSGFHPMIQPTGWRLQHLGRAEAQQVSAGPTVRIREPMSALWSWQNLLGHHSFIFQSCPTQAGRDLLPIEPNQFQNMQRSSFSHMIPLLSFLWVHRAASSRPAVSTYQELAFSAFRVSKFPLTKKAA